MSGAPQRPHCDCGFVLEPGPCPVCETHAYDAQQLHGCVFDVVMMAICLAIGVAVSTWIVP